MNRDEVASAVAKRLGIHVSKEKYAAKVWDALIDSELRNAELSSPVIRCQKCGGTLIWKRTEDGFKVWEDSCGGRGRAEAAELRIQELSEALRACMKWMKDLADSGDAGFFGATDIDEYVKAEALLSAKENGV